MVKTLFSTQIPNWVGSKHKSPIGGLLVTGPDQPVNEVTRALVTLSLTSQPEIVTLVAFPGLQSLKTVSVIKNVLAPVWVTWKSPPMMWVAKVERVINDDKSKVNIFLIAQNTGRYF